MNRRQLITSVAAAAVLPAAAPTAGRSSGRPGPWFGAEPHDYESLTELAVEDLQSSLPPGTILHHRHHSIPDQPLILAYVAFVVDTGKVRWARPAMLNALRYGKTRDTDIVIGDEIFDLSIHGSRPWSDLDPPGALARWQMILDDATAAILERAVRDA